MMRSEYDRRRAGILAAHSWEVCDRDYTLKLSCSQCLEQNWDWLNRGVVLSEHFYDITHDEQILFSLFVLEAQLLDP